jgi:hypothetical protein
VVPVNRPAYQVVHPNRAGIRTSARARDQTLSGRPQADDDRLEVRDHGRPAPRLRPPMTVEWMDWMSADHMEPGKTSMRPRCEWAVCWAEQILDVWEVYDLSLGIITRHWTLA